MASAILFVALFLLTATVGSGQQDCPTDSAAECPDSCTGEQCARFLNAECRVNPCHDLCTVNFFWKGRNVTDRCAVERCSDKVCPGARECVEEIRPPSCPEGLPKSLCRQYIQARCVLPPPPSDCSQITCDQGMICRERRRDKGVHCVRAHNCEQLSCNEGTICSETEQGPLCVTSIQLSCSELDCPKGTVCVSDSVPSRNLSVARCLSEEEAALLPTFDTFFCNSGATICDSEPQPEACADIFDSGSYLVPGCLEVGCDPEIPTSCRLNGQVCVPSPDFLDAPFTSVCIGSSSIVNDTATCESAPADRCPSHLTCREVFYEGQLFFTTCGIPAPTFTAPSCAALECPSPLECNELGVVEDRGGVARCAGPNFTGDTADSIQSLLDMIE